MLIILSILLNSKWCCAKDYAILISAGETINDTINNQEYWSDLFITYKTLLLNESYDSTNVFVFYGSGIDYSSSNTMYSKANYDWGKITDYDNSWSTMTSAFDSIGNIITNDDNLLIFWLVGHGGINHTATDETSIVNSYFVGFNNRPYYINKESLYNLFSRVPNYRKRKIFWMTCYAGCMAMGDYNLCNDKTVFIASSKYNEYSYSFRDDIAGWRVSFDAAFNSLLTGVYPDGSIMDFTIATGYMVNDIDGILSLQELYESIDNFNYRNYISSTYIMLQHIDPYIKDNGGIASKVFVNEHLSQNDMNFTDYAGNYWVDDIIISNSTYNNSIIHIETDNNAIIKENSFFGNNTELIVK